MTRVAVFEDGTHAVETARILHEQGYEAAVATEGTDSFGAAAKRFFAGDTQQFRTTAVVTSDDADEESFVNVVNVHYGRVITGTV